MKISERLEPKILLVEGAAAKGFTTEVDVRLLFQFATGRAPVLFIYEAGSIFVLYIQGSPPHLFYRGSFEAIKFGFSFGQ